ncbi:T9SS type A sorting domain-containing protein [Cryomorphaceae bacterium 1068]|nr:T9SS type A sorting domain-containing protein [Cryomorphaceae bacterium 1068]
MKRFFTLSFILLSIALFGQNLIPDGSAENYLECPSNFGDIETWLPTWQSFRGSPDYFNSCSSGLGWDNDLGYQEPRTGEGYLGLATFSKNLPNVREYFGVELMKPLVIGQEYFLTFYVSRAHQSNTFNAASNNIGALFLVDNNLNPEEQGPTPNFANFNEIEIVEDTVNWVEMSYQFIADEAYQFVTFGNFYEDSLTDTLRIGGEQTGEITPYYYFDDFCLTTSPDGCDFTNSVRNQYRFEVSVYPNPCIDVIYIEQETPMIKLEIHSPSGVLLESQMLNGRKRVKLSIDLPSGLYFSTIYSMHHRITKRFVVEN